jgi:hypothetical protein
MVRTSAILLAVVFHGERLGVVAAAAAGVALDPHIGQKVHFDLLLPHPLAGFAPPALLVEAEPSRVIAAHLRLRQAGEQFADEVKHAVYTWPGWRRASSRSGPDRH